MSDTQIGVNCTPEISIQCIYGIHKLSNTKNIKDETYPAGLCRYLACTGHSRVKQGIKSCNCTLFQTGKKARSKDE